MHQFMMFSWFFPLTEMAGNFHSLQKWHAILNGITQCITRLVLNTAPNSPDAVSVQHHPRVLSLWMLPSLGSILTPLNQAVCLLTLLRIQNTFPRHAAEGTLEIPWKKRKLHMVFFICGLCSETMMHLLDCWHLGINPHWIRLPAISCCLRYDLCLYCYSAPLKQDYPSGKPPLLNIYEQVWSRDSQTQVLSKKTSCGQLSSVNCRSHQGGMTIWCDMLLLNGLLGLRDSVP